MSWAKTHLQPAGTIGLHHAARVLGCKEEEVLNFAREGQILLTPFCFEDVEKAGKKLGEICWSFDRQSVEALWPRLQNQGLTKTMREISEIHTNISTLKEIVRLGQEECGEKIERLEATMSDCYEILNRILSKDRAMK